MFDSDEPDKCTEEAIRLALSHNFVTEVTSMVVEEADEYATKRSLEEIELKQKDDTTYSYVPRSSGSSVSGYKYNVGPPGGPPQNYPTLPSNRLEVQNFDLIFFFSNQSLISLALAYCNWIIHG